MAPLINADEVDVLLRKHLPEESIAPRIIIQTVHEDQSCFGIGRRITVRLEGDSIHFNLSSLWEILLVETDIPLIHHLNAAGGVSLEPLV